MSRIRTLNDLHDCLSAEFAWRKVELHKLKSMVESARGTHTMNLCVRAAVAVLYAHWEGFIKKVGTDYLEFIASRRMKNDELPDHLLALAMSQIERGSTYGARVGAYARLVEFFRSKGQSRTPLSWKGAVNTKSNLKSDVLADICFVLGLDFSKFETKKNLIDEKLLRNRNEIAHGQYLLVPIDEYLGLHGEVFAMMQDFFNQVENNAITGAFRRAPAAGVVHGQA